MVEDSTPFLTLKHAFADTYSDKSPYESEEEEVLSGPLIEAKYHEALRNSKLTSPREQTKTVLIEGRLAEAVRHEINAYEQLEEDLRNKRISLATEAGPESPEVQAMSSLPDDALIEHLVQTLNSPSPAKKWYIPIRLVTRILYDDRGEGAAQLHKPVRLIAQMFRLNGCPKNILSHWLKLSDKAIEEWDKRETNRNYKYFLRKNALHQDNSQTSQKTILLWNMVLYRFVTVASWIYMNYVGYDDNFYSYFLRDYIQLGEIHPYLTRANIRKEEEAER